MFDRIAGRYDLMNRVMTMGIDRHWRNVTVNAAHVTDTSTALDVCCGTGDLTFAMARRGTKVTGLDFSSEMLEVARARTLKQPGEVAERVAFVQGDALDLPFEDDSFDAATVGFGVRNVADLGKALSEMRRVVRPGGRVVVLEITRPKNPAANAFHGVWFDRIVPLIGGVIAGDRDAYSYLPESTKHFPRPPALKECMQRAGLADVTWRTFAGGLVAMHVGTPTSVPAHVPERELNGAPS
jgi:demethylmenaquinone methyltransferase/2-methoxy-6-polyprenyl-1,4-benzoquinol methylase